MNNKGMAILILIVVLLLTANTFAWFLFNKSINMSIESKVKSWNLNFSDNGQMIEEAVTFEIESIYPGMPDESKTIIVTNNGEIAADIRYEIKSITLLGESKIVGENCTKQELDDYINSLPFIIKVEQEKDYIESGGDEVTLKISFDWPFEDEQDTAAITEKDKLDTELGQKAYEYNNSTGNVEGYNFKMELELIAKQKNV